MTTRPASSSADTDLRRMLRGCLHRGWRVQILAVPELEHQKLPQPQRVISCVRPDARRRACRRRLVRNTRAAAFATTSARPRRPRSDPPRNHTPSGTPNPCFFRSAMPGGSSERTDSFRMCLRRPLAILKWAGSVAAKSMTRLSRSGTRDSIECAMLMRSTLVSTSSGRYVSKSKRIIRLWCGSASNLLESRRRRSSPHSTSRATGAPRASTRRSFRPPERRRRVQVPAIVVARDVSEKILAAEPVRQQRPDCAGEPPRAGYAHTIELRHTRVRQVAVVSAEQLVAAVARQHHGDVPAGNLRDIPGRNRRRVRERLVEMLDQPIENRQAVRSHDELMVFSAEVLARRCGRAPVRRTEARRTRSRTSAPAWTKPRPSARRQRSSRRRPRGMPRAARR